MEKPSQHLPLFSMILLLTTAILSLQNCNKPTATGPEAVDSTLTRLPGFRGIWYSNQPSNDEYVYKYSGGLGTYPAKHNPFAVYRPQVDKTFFCYGGTDFDSANTLLHMVSVFDHKTQMVARPYVLLDKETRDAHDNPVISMDKEGHIWIFSTSHGVSRPSYIHKSLNPYDPSSFERIDATRMENGQEVPLDNFSYLQVWHDGEQFLAFVTMYKQDTVINRSVRTINFMSSHDGIQWSEVQLLSALDEGHYQISNVWQNTAGTAFNFHPSISEEIRGLNLRTNLYYLATSDHGKSWQNAEGETVNIPLDNPRHPSLVRDYQSEGLLVYLKDLAYDQEGNPVILHITSKGYEAGPKNNPRTWRIARWDGQAWVFSDITTSDNNYDMGSLYIESDQLWRVIGPTETGPQAFNPGGEIALWESYDQGQTWTMKRQLTEGSEFNHTYVRRPVNAHSEFYGIWADGHGRKPSESRIYITDSEGNACQLPYTIEDDAEWVKPVKINP